MPYEPDENATPLSTGRASQVLRRHEVELMAIEGVVGVSVARNPIGEEVIKVWVREAGIQRAIPDHLEGVPVEVEITGDIDAF